MPPRILVVDDHAIVRQAFRRLLEQDGLNVVGEAWENTEAHTLARELRADVVVLGFTRPFAGCLLVVHEILRTNPRTGVILFADEEYLAVKAFRAGIRGYVMKTRVVEELPQAIRKVAGGGIYLSRSIPDAIVKSCLAMMEHVRADA